MQKTLVKRKARVSKIVGKGRGKSTNEAEMTNGKGEEITAAAAVSFRRRRERD